MNDSSRTPLTAILADWATNLRYEDLPDQVIHQAKRVILDYLAATIVGSTSGPAGIVQRYVAETEGQGPCAVLGTSMRFSAGNAALANGTAAHGLEVDDGYTPGGFHPGGPTLSAVLAAAESRGSSAEEILLATVVGFETCCRLAGAAHPATWRRGFHNTPIAGVFGATAGVTRVIGGDMANAFGIAASHAGGIFEFLGSGAEVKRLHAGKAARDGLLSAELAARGLTGPVTALEGKNGYLHAFAGDDYDEAHLIGELGNAWRMLNTYVKPYPCCRHVHGPIDAVLQLKDESPIDVDEVESVLVQTFTSASRHGGKQIDDLLDAQMSIPYAVAVSMLHGAPSLEHFDERFRKDPRVQRLVDLVEVEESADCTRDFPQMRPARVSVRLGGGERIVRIDQPYGEPSNPVSDEGLESKFLALASPVIGEARSKQIISEVWSFESPGRLFATLGGGN